jgi:hypothetical protein
MICAFNRYDIVQFTFQLYDENDDGCMKKDECQRMLENLCGVGAETESKEGRKKYGAKAGDRRASGQFFYPREMASALKAFDLFKAEQDNGLSALGVTEFRDYAEACPRIVFPLYRLQFSVQKATLGAKRWTQVIQNVDSRRVDLKETKRKMDEKRKLGHEVLEVEEQEYKVESVNLS